MQAALRKSTIDDQVRYPLRMAARVGNGERGSLRKPNQREFLKTGLIHYSLKIRKQASERDVRYVALRQTNSSSIVSQQCVPVRETQYLMAKDGALEIAFEMREPVWETHDWRPF